uniref:hypothetical protein n=1 Tax=Aquimarina algiphila TaxID=2047982 RepID=UPI00232F3708
GDGIFSGWGYITVPYLQDTKLKVSFTGIRINTDYQLTEGMVMTDYDQNWGGVSDVRDELEALQSIGDAILEILENFTGTPEQIADLQEQNQNQQAEIEQLLANPYVSEEVKENIRRYDEASDNFDNELIADASANGPNPDGYDTSQQQQAQSRLNQSIAEANQQIDDAKEEVSTISFDFEIPQPLDHTYKEEKLPHDIRPSDASMQVFDYEGILSSEFENYFKNLSVGGKYKVRVYTYNSQSDLLRAIESITPRENEIILFIQKKDDKALIKISLGTSVSNDLLKKGITKEDLFASIKASSPTELKKSVVFKEIKSNLVSYLLVQEAEAYDGNITALLAIKLLDWGISGIDNFKLPSKYYDPSVSGYISLFGNDRIQNAFICGIFNGLINEAKAIPELASMLIKVSSSGENQKRLKQDIDKLLEEGILSTLIKGYAQRYTGKSDAIISYNAGKDVVAVATIFVSFTTVTKAGKVTSVVKLVNPLQGALDLFKFASRAGLSIQRSGKNIILYVGNNINKVVAKIDAKNIFRQIKWLDKGTPLEVIENIRYIDEIGNETVGTLTIVKNGDEVGIKINNNAGSVFKKVTKAIAKQELSADFVNALKKMDFTEDKILERFVKYHNDNDFRFFNEISDLMKKYPQLNKTDVNLLWGYTTNIFYKKMNGWLRWGENISKTTEIKNLFNNTLSKLQNFKGTNVFRGIEIDSKGLTDFLNSYKKGAKPIWEDFTSAGSSKSASFADRPEVNVLFDIKHLDAKDISDFADGIKFRGNPRSEVLIKSGSQFEVVKSPYYLKKDKKWIIELVQIK